MQEFALQREETTFFSIPRCNYTSAFQVQKAVSAFRFGYLRIYSGVACSYYRPFKVRLIKFKVVSPTCSCLAICEIVDIMYLIFCSIMVGHITVHLCVKSRKHYNIIICNTSPLPSLPW